MAKGNSGFLLLSRQIGETLWIGELPVTLVSVDYDYNRRLIENTAVFKMGEKLVTLRQEQGYSVNADVYLVLNDLNPSNARIAIKAPKSIPIVRDDTRKILDPPQVAESPLERQRRLNY